MKYRYISVRLIKKKSTKTDSYTESTPRKNRDRQVFGNLNSYLFGITESSYLYYYFGKLNNHVNLNTFSIKETKEYLPSKIEKE